MADKTMSIEQMEQILIKLQGKPDGKVAGELEGVQLAERVTPARLAKWEAEFPGKQTREQLVKLADMTSFLNPPASDVLRDPPPDVETEERMLAMAFRRHAHASDRVHLLRCDGDGRARRDGASNSDPWLGQHHRISGAAQHGPIQHDGDLPRWA
jgi:hypothetical protein